MPHGSAHHFDHQVFRLGRGRIIDDDILVRTCPATRHIVDALGGNRRVVGNAEVLFGMPGMGSEKSVRLSGFVDAGNVWGYGNKLSFSDIRYSVGVAVSWNSPFGPLKFSFANPVRHKPEDKVQRLQFQLGSTF